MERNFVLRLVQMTALFLPWAVDLQAVRSLKTELLSLAVAYSVWIILVHQLVECREYTKIKCRCSHWFHQLQYNALPFGYMLAWILPHIFIFCWTSVVKFYLIIPLAPSMVLLSICIENAVAASRWIAAISQFCQCSPESCLKARQLLLQHLILLLSKNSETGRVWHT